MSAPAVQSARAFRASLWKPRFDGLLSEWAEGLKLPQSERGTTFSLDESPWLKEPADALVNPEVRQVTFVGAAGAAKTLLGEIYVGYIVKESGGITYYVWQEDDSARDQMQDRVQPLLEANSEIAEVLPTERERKRIVKLRTRTGTIYALGANKNNARSKRVRNLICEETHLWKKGMLTLFKKRCNAVGSPKILVLSTGTNTGDETDTDLTTGTYHRWHVLCPECKRAQMMRNSNLRGWDTANVIDLEGRYRWAAIRASVYYQCEHCPAQWKDTPRVRRWLNDTGHYVQTNPEADPRNESYNIHGLAIKWNDWGDMAVRWILANIAKREGDLTLLEACIKEDFAESWDLVPRDDNPHRSEKRAGKYGPVDGTIWSIKTKAPEWLDPSNNPDDFGEIARYMTIDKQEAWFTVTIRAYAVDGESRLVYCGGGVSPDKPGAIVTWEEIEDLREMYGVQASKTWADCTHFTKEVQARAVQYGYRCFWASPQKTFPHDRTSYYHPYQEAKRARKPESILKQIDPKPIYLPFSMPKKGHANIGKAGKPEHCIYVFIGMGDKASVIKDHWHFIHNGQGPSWTHYQGVPKWYLQQTTAEVRRKKGEVWEWWHGTRANHATDCEEMNHACAMMDDRINVSASVSATVTEDALAAVE